MSRPDAGDRRGLGYLLVLGAAVLWGASGPMSVELFGLGAEPESLALLRPLLGATALVLFGLLKNPSALRPEPRDLAIMLAAGGVLVGVFQLSFQFSTESVGVPTTVGLLYLAPAIVVAASGPALGEWPGGRTAALAGVSVLGVWLMVRGAGAQGPDGSLVWGVLCGASFAGYTLFGRATTARLGAFGVILWSTVGGSLVLIAAWAFGALDVTIPPARAWPLLVVFAVTTMSVAAVLYFAGLEHIEAGRAAIVATAEPVVASVLAALLLGQVMSPLGWAGLLLVVGGVAGAYGLDGRSVTEPH